MVSLPRWFRAIFLETWVCGDGGDVSFYQKIRFVIRIFRRSYL